jgi:hypothetical protein
MKMFTGGAHAKVCLLAGAASLGGLHLLMGYFSPNLSGRMGHDYSYFLPRLLDGYLWWRQNGFFAVPWFTPSFFGGIPSFPNPQNMYYSIPQALTIPFGPLTAVYITILLFGALGFGGMYLLLAGPFRASPAVCVFGAFIFMFNGFFLARMIVGHFAFHSFMLTPWIVFFLVRRTEGAPAPALLRDSAAAGLMLAYMAFSGGLALAPMMVAAILMAGLIHIAAEGGARQFAIRFAAAGAFSLGLSAAKLVSSAAFIGWFPREYPHIGAGQALGAIYIAASALLLPTDGKVESYLLTNKRFGVGLHEFDFSVSPIPALLAIIGGYAAVRGYFANGASPLAPKGWRAAVGAALLAMVPIALNCDSPAIAHLAKSLPILKSSTSQLRWMAIYIPSLIILAALALERTAILAPRRELIAAIGIALFMFSALARDWNYYFRQGYNPKPVATAYGMIKDGKATGRIDNIAIAGYKDGEMASKTHPATGTMFVLGASPIYAYEPIFGYRLETLPMGALAPGPVMREREGRLNLKNPACYLFPEENGRRPGDHFTMAQKDQAELFRRYRPFPFVIPMRQKIANALSLIFIPLTALALAAPVWARPRPTIL